MGKIERVFVDLLGLGRNENARFVLNIKRDRSCRRRRRNNMASLAFLRRCTRGVGNFRSPLVYNSAGRFRSVNSAAPNQGSRPRLIQPPAVDGGAEVVGCSHGWVALFNKRDNSLFLSDPLSQKQIKLPPIDTLPDPEFNLDLDGEGSVSKLVLSSSPYDEECRAMMTFGPANRLAFCLPRRSSEWTPIGDLFFDFNWNYPHESIAKVHEDLVYCSRRKVFTSITSARLDLKSLWFEHFRFTPKRCDWDIEDPDCPKLVRSEEVYIYGCKNGSRSWIDDNIELLENECIQIPHLVYAEEQDRLFVVIQFVRLLKEEGGPPLGFVPRCEPKGISGVYPGKTFGFIVLDVDDYDDDDDEEGGIIRERELDDLRKCWVVNDLSGISMFVGINHSFAFDAGKDLDFKPNSIYFTDSKRLKRVCGVNDNGLFDYASKTMSSPLLRRDRVPPLPSFKASAPYWFV